MRDFRGLTQRNRLLLLRAIQRRPGRRVDELAKECDIAVNTVRDHLRVLENEGLIRGEPVPASGRGRPPVVFHPVQQATANASAAQRLEGARRRGALLRDLNEPAGTTIDLDPAAQTQLDLLYEHLDDVGLDPEVDEDTLVFELTPCRYRTMMDDDHELVCSVHVQLVNDVLHQVEGPLTLQRLDPFVTEHSCRLVLSRGPAEPPGGADRTAIPAQRDGSVDRPSTAGTAATTGPPGRGGETTP